jgi:hypothetical protein
VKDLTTYVLSYAAILAAGIAVMGMLASTFQPAPASASEPQVMVVNADATLVAASMNIPF